MRFIYFLLGLLLIAVAVMQNMLWLAGLFAIFFTIYFGATGLFVLAVLIDGYFGAFSSFPVFSSIAVVWYLVSELLRLRVRIME